MHYMYTNEPDEACHEINGVFGRPIHTHEKPVLLKKGWVTNPSDLEDFKPAIPLEIIEQYRNKFGQKPHHRMKLETIQEALNDQGQNSEPDSQPAGD